jgi:membrane protein YqaA with SNARE-associated domain
MELAPVAFLTILVAIAGSVGITLGWWLGKGSERERTAREERKSAYVAFTTTFEHRPAPDPTGVHDERLSGQN